jgi:predicted ferric reductase
MGTYITEVIIAYLDENVHPLPLGSRFVTILSMKWHQKLIGLLALVLITVPPIIYWLLATTATYSLNLSSILLLLGKLVALMGIILFLVNPILSMRHAVVVRIFGSLDMLYTLHKHSGKLSFFLILCHPLLLGSGRLLSGDSLLDMWSWTSLLIISGVVSLLLISALTAVAIYAHIKHQNWVKIHRMFGWAIPLVLLHAFIAKGQIYQLAPLRFYIITLGVLGFSAFIYRSVLSRYLVKRYRYRVEEIVAERGNVTGVTLKPLATPLSYIPGQFAFVSFMQDDLSSEAHPYSFTTANNGPYIQFGIKGLGDDTRELSQKLRLGSPAFLEGPYGGFTQLSVKNKKQIWIAGGVGITPFLSMARALNTEDQEDITLFYAAQQKVDAAFLEELHDIAKIVRPFFKVFIVDEKISGFVSTTMIQDTMGSITEYDYLVCGPPVMMRSIVGQLHKAGVKKTQIHLEAFSM